MRMRGQPLAPQRANALRDAGGKVLIWTGSSTDIDDQKCSENALKEADRRKNEFLAMLATNCGTPWRR